MVEAEKLDKQNNGMKKAYDVFISYRRDKGSDIAGNGLQKHKVRDNRVPQSL